MEVRPSSFILNLYCFLTLFIILGCSQGVFIQLFEEKSFTGLTFESNSTAACNEIPLNKYTGVSSIRTDTCIIVYHFEQNCKGFYTKKYMPGETTVSGNYLNWTRSFHICNEEEGGDQLNLDIRKFYGHQDGSSADVLKSYKNVCSCVNVPQHVQNLSLWSIDNHHNSLLAYNEPDCCVNKWNPTFIRPGHYGDSLNMQNHWKIDSGTNTTYKIQSFGPDPKSSYFLTICFNKLFQVLPNQVVELQRKQKQDLDKHAKQIKQLEQQLANFTKRVRADLFKVLA